MTNSISAVFKNACRNCIEAGTWVRPTGGPRNRPMTGDPLLCDAHAGEPTAQPTGEPTGGPAAWATPTPAMGLAKVTNLSFGKYRHIDENWQVIHPGNKPGLTFTPVSGTVAYVYAIEVNGTMGFTISLVPHAFGIDWQDDGAHKWEYAGPFFLDEHVGAKELCQCAEGLFMEYIVQRRYGAILKAPCEPRRRRASKAFNTYGTDPSMAPSPAYASGFATEQECLLHALAGGSVGPVTWQQGIGLGNQARPQYLYLDSVADHISNMSFAGPGSQMSASVYSAGCADARVHLYDMHAKHGEVITTHRFPFANTSDLKCIAEQLVADLL